MSFFTLTSNVSPSHAVRAFLISVLGFFVFLSALSIVIDPEGIYLKKPMVERDAKSFVRALLSSDNGVVSSGSERQIKIELARTSDADCFVIGSSRSMQASLRSNSWLSEKCNRLANLGVSGASLEDIMIYSSLLLEKPPANVFLFVDPWILTFNSDVRWKQHEGIFQSFYGQSTGDDKSYFFSLLSNALNYEYVKSSLNLLFEEGINSLPSFKPKDSELAPDFHIDEGYEKRVILPDGSLVYSSERIRESAVRIVGSGDYKMNSIGVESEASQALLYTVEKLKESGHEVKFILSPYNPHVYSLHGNDELLSKVGEVESAVRNLAKVEGITLGGGYNPDDFECGSDEFYDAIHPKFSCIAKLVAR